MIKISEYFIRDIKLGDSAVSVSTDNLDSTDNPDSFEKMITSLAKQYLCTRVYNPVVYYIGKKRITDFKIRFKSKVDKERFIKALTKSVNA